MPSKKIALSPAEQAIVEEAWAKKNPSVFLNYFMKPPDGGFMVLPGSVRHTQYLKHWLSIDKPSEFIVESSEIKFNVVPRFGDYHEHAQGLAGQEVVTNIAFFEKRGYILLPWALKEFRAPQTRHTVIGTPGTGKTLNRGLMGALFKCATIPYYRFLNVAPSVYQSNIMIRELRQRVIGTLFERKFLRPGTRGYKLKPYVTYLYQNESTAEMMNVAKNADNIQGWRGDEINFDEAGLANGSNDIGGVELADMIPGIVSRMTGVRPDGIPRSGMLNLISMAYDNDALWQLYDYGLLPETQSQYFSMKITRDDNPYITPKQWADIVRDIELNNPPAIANAWLNGERPAKKGSEFSAELIDSFLCETQMEEARADPETLFEEGRHGITTYREPYRKDHVYLIAGDPGLGEPPFRNAPVVEVFDVTNFPKEKARLVGMWWGYANGSIEPFLNTFAAWASFYRVPEIFRGYDATGAQKHMSELAWQVGEDAVVPMGFEGSKKYEYLNALKILLSKFLIQAPKGINGLENQLRNYRLPDKKIAQDLVSTLCMACFLMFPLYRDEYPEEMNEEQSEEMYRNMVAQSSRSYRPREDRYGDHRR